MSRKWVSTVISILAGLALTASGVNATNLPNHVTKRASGSQPITLTVYTYPMLPNVWAYLQQHVIFPFEKVHPNIKIVWNQTNSAYQLEEQQMAAGGGPDILEDPGPGTLREWASAGYALPLTQYAKKYDWMRKFQSWSLPSGMVHGVLYGIPTQIETMVVYYNENMFQKYHWQIPHNWNQLVALCKAAQSKGIIPFAFGNSNFKQAEEWWLTEAYNEALGASAFQKVLENKVPWNSPEMVNATNKLVDLWKAGYINDREEFALTINDATNLLLQGKAAMKMEGTWLLGGLVPTKVPFTWGQFLMPSWTPGVPMNAPLALGTSIGINKNSKHPAAAAEFINWFYATKSAALAQMKFGDFYPLNGLSVTSKSGVDPHIVYQYNLIQNAVKRGDIGYSAWVYWPQDVETYLWENLESVYLGQLSVKSYLGKAEQLAVQDQKQGKLYPFPK